MPARGHILVRRDETGAFNRRDFFKGSLWVGALSRTNWARALVEGVGDMVFKRSFTDQSWWNRPATGVPVDPNSAKYLAGQSQVEGGKPIGIGTGAWAMPFGDADHTGSKTTITNKKGQKVTLHVKKTGQMSGNDAAVVWRCWGCDLEVSAFEWDGGTRCTNFGVYRLSGDGVDKAAGGDGPGGHRGIPPSAMMITLQELTDGYIGHRLKMALGPPGDHRLDGKAMPIWPMAGWEKGRSGVIPEGAVLRLKAGAYDRVKPTGAAGVVARAIRDFGFIVGETGGHATCKAEQASSYPAGLSTALSKFTWQDYDVLQLGWGKV